MKCSTPNIKNPKKLTTPMLFGNEQVQVTETRVSGICAVELEIPIVSE